MAAALQRQAQKLAAQLDIPLEQMPSANAARQRQESDEPQDSAGQPSSPADPAAQASRSGEKSTNDAK